MAATAPSIDWSSLKFLTPEETAAVLGVSSSQVHTLVSGNHLPSFRIGGEDKGRAQGG